MSMDEWEYGQEEYRDNLRCEIEQEVWPQHQAEAIDGFTSERLCSFYDQNPNMMDRAFSSVNVRRTPGDYGFERPAAQRAGVS